MSFSIAWLRAGISGCFGFAWRRELRCCIFCLVSWGISLVLLLILPFGMWCRSAMSMMFVRMVFEVWTSVGGPVCAMAVSISSVKSVQFALL